MTAPTTEVRRGSFIQDGTTFDVCASSAHAPESMRVYLAGDRTALVLVVSGLNSGDLKPSWGQPWGSYQDQWREDFEERAYRAYVSRDTGLRPTVRATAVVRVCEG